MVVKVASTFSVKMLQLWSTRKSVLGSFSSPLHTFFRHLWQSMLEVIDVDSRLVMLLRLYFIFSPPNPDYFPACCIPYLSNMIFPVSGPSCAIRITILWSCFTVNAMGGESAGKSRLMWFYSIQSPEQPFTVNLLPHCKPVFLWLFSASWSPGVSGYFLKELMWTKDAL